VPLLPSSLVDAFAGILFLHVDIAHIATMSTVLSERSTERDLGPETSKGGLAKRIWQRKWRHMRFQDAIHGYLDNAREELIRGIAAQRLSNTRLGPVGSEYIVAAVLGNVQSDALRGSQGLGSRLIPIFNEQTVDTINIFEVYEAHMTRLQFSAAQKSQRSLFLAIGAFEEGLAALRHVLKLQMHYLQDTAHVSDPSSFRDEPADRSDRSLLEKALIQRKYQDHRQEDEKLQRLERRAKALRSKVKEGIKVLDEGHGQAIRVFTLVTVFSLSL
jgi:hypothetical protein